MADVTKLRLAGFFVLFHCLALPVRLSAQTPRDFVVDLRAQTATNTPCITLSWSLQRPSNIVSQKIHRRLKGAAAWAKLADLATNQTSYADVSATSGVPYEYWMERTYAGIYPETAMGYLCAGENVPAVEFRGKLLLVVDDTVAAPLSPEIGRLSGDLTGDGWTVQLLTVSRSGTAASVKSQIVSAFMTDPENVKMVFLLGHVPVPYSGNHAPDGRSGHVGAWPADCFYGDLDGTWTDAFVNNTAADRPQNDNVPGDGKYDQTMLPSPVELSVGRVDMHSLTRAPSAAVSELSLLRRYLQKTHDFRMRNGAYGSIPKRSLIRDGCGYFDGEAFSMCGWSWAYTSAGSQVS
jgi:hypothetical protein